MKMVSRILLIVISLVSFTLKGNAQALKNFTPDPVKFAEEMQKFLEETDKKEGSKIMEEFIIEWNGGKFNPTQQDAIYKTSNSMLRKRMKAFPDFKNYIIALTSFARSKQTKQSFTAWQCRQSILRIILSHVIIYSEIIHFINLLLQTGIAITAHTLLNLIRCRKLFSLQ